MPCRMPLDPELQFSGTPLEEVARCTVDKALLGTSVLLCLTVWFSSELERAGLAWMETVYFHGDSRRQKERVGKKETFNVADALLLGHPPGPCSRTSWAFLPEN